MILEELNTANTIGMTITLMAWCFLLWRIYKLVFMKSKRKGNTDGRTTIKI